MAKKGFIKFLSLFLSIVVIGLLFTGCGNKDAGNTSTADSNAAQQTSTGEKASEATVKAPEEASGTMTIWYWDKSGFDIMWNEFTKVYKNAKLNYVAVNSGDYLVKIQSSLAAGTDLPDLLLGEMGSRGKLISLDIWDNLLAAPYNVDTSKLMDFVIPLGSNAKGELCGVDNLMCPAGLAYKADLAKEYFGTDDPQQLHDLMPDWNTFVEKGKEVKEKSGGKVFMLPCINDAMTILLGQKPESVVEGNKAINLDKVYGESFKTAAAMRDAGILDKLGTWSPAWNASFAQDKHIFYPCASWGPQFVIQPNDKDSQGRWRVMIPPEGGFYSGGTIWGVYKKSKVKDITWGYINWTIFGDGANVYREKLGYFVPRKDLYAEGNYDYSKDGDPYFNGQNVKELFFKTIAPTLKVRPVTQYDQQYGDVLGLIGAALEKDPTLTADKAIQNFKDELKKKIPELEITQ